MRKCITLVLLVSMAVLTGCASVRKTTPAMGFGGLSAEVKMERDDIEILDSVEGVSTVLSILPPLIQIIDDTDMRVLGISAMEDRVSFAEPVPFPMSIIQNLLGPRGAMDRAYFNALSKAPDADAVFSKSYQIQKRGIPLIFMREKVVFKGKAFKIKADK